MHDLFAVFVDQIDDAVFNLQLGGNRSGVFNILLCGAIGERHLFIHPSSNVGTLDCVALLFEHQGRNGAIHASGQGD